MRRAVAPQTPARSRFASVLTFRNPSPPPPTPDPRPRRQSRLRELQLGLPARQDSENFLPQSLTRLKLLGPNCGPMWLRSVARCSLLERLELSRLGVEDLGRWVGAGGWGGGEGSGGMIKG